MKLIVCVYSKLLNLYPSFYKNRFKNEQLIVFQEKLQDERQYGFLKRLTCICHEILSLMAGVIDSYIELLGGKEMFAFKRILTTNLVCFTTTFVLLALVNVIGRYGLDYSSNIPKPLNYVIWLFLSGVIMAFCGWFVSSSISVKRKFPYAIAFGGGYILSRLTTSTYFWSEIGISTTSSWESFTVLFSSMVDGLIIGLLFGGLWKGWKASILYAVSGGIIFELGYWANWLTLYFFNIQLQHVVIPGNVGYGWIILSWVLAYVFFGLIIGGLWSILIDRSNHQLTGEKIIPT